MNRTKQCNDNLIPVNHFKLLLYHFSSSSFSYSSCSSCSVHGYTRHNVYTATYNKRFKHKLAILTVLRRVKTSLEHLVKSYFTLNCGIIWIFLDFLLSSSFKPYWRQIKFAFSFLLGFFIGCMCVGAIVQNNYIFGWKKKKLGDFQYLQQNSYHFHTKPINSINWRQIKIDRKTTLR